jgi:hypothetical protein
MYKGFSKWCKERMVESFDDLPDLPMPNYDLPELPPIQRSNPADKYKSKFVRGLPPGHFDKIHPDVMDKLDKSSLDHEAHKEKYPQYHGPATSYKDYFDNKSPLSSQQSYNKVLDHCTKIYNSLGDLYKELTAMKEAVSKTAHYYPENSKHQASMLKNIDEMEDAIALALHALERADKKLSGK